MTTLRPASSLDVAVLSPHAVVVHGVAAVLASYDPHVAVHDLGNGRSGVRPAWADVVVVDSALLASGGPTARACVVDVDDDGRATVLLLRPEHAGAVTAAVASSGAALLPFSADGPTLANAVRRAARARPVAARDARAASAAAAAAAARDLPAELSDREVDVLRGIAAGCSNEEIAAVLFVSINTVKTYIRTAYRKLRVGRRAAAVAWVLAHEPLLRGRAGEHLFPCGSARP